MRWAIANRPGTRSGKRANPAIRADLGALVSALLAKRVVVRNGKTTARMTRLEHLLHRLLEKAIAGDPRLMKIALDEVRKAEARTADDAFEGASGEAMDAADAEVVKALVARLTREAELRVARKTECGTV